MKLRKVARVALWITAIGVSLTIAGLRILSWYVAKTPELTTDYNVPVHVSVYDSAYHEQITKAREQLFRLLHERQTPSISIAVSLRGKTVWSETVGYSDLEQKLPATCTTMYRTNSVSKLFTSALAARLSERGKFSWDEDIRNYVHEFPDKGSPITARQLASHRSGIRGYRDDHEATQTKRYPTITASLEIFKDDPLLFEPGKGFHYSGFGYVLLSLALEKSGGKKFTTLVEDEVFSTLDMKRSAAALSAYEAEPVYYDNVTPYSPDGSLVISPPNDFSFKLAAGGFLSTAEDLLKFGDAHIKSLNKKFLTHESIDRLFRPQDSHVPAFGYGLGWMSAIDPELRRAHFHFGAGSGGTSLLVIYPGQEMTMAILSNLGHARFPMNRLLALTDSFQYGNTRIIFNLWLMFLTATAVYKLVNRFNKKRQGL